MKSRRSFFDLFQFPDCVGAVDDTHIPIRKPDKDPASYFDYKNQHSVHLQIVCDARTRVLFYYVGAPGKNSDGGVAEMSGLKNLMKDGRIPKKYHMVGDPAFALHHNLLNRFAGLHLLEFESRYNWRQSRCRMVVESYFGRIKGRWRVLLKPMPYKDLDLVNKIVVSCVLLHNFLLTKDDSILHPHHHFLDQEYRDLMKKLDDAREEALAAHNRGKKRKVNDLPATEKRQVIAKALDNELSEENCVLFLGM